MPGGWGLDPRGGKTGDTRRKVTRCGKFIRDDIGSDPVKYWGIIADKLSAAAWSRGYCSAVTRDGWRWIVDAHREDGRRYIVHSDELLTAFLELEATLL